MSLNFDMAPMLGDNFSDSQLAGDHRVLHGGVARGIGSFGGVCRRERARVASRTSETARRRPEAQLGEGALVMRGGERRGREHGIDPPSGGGRAGVQETSIPLVWCSRAWSDFCCSCVLTAVQKTLPVAWCRGKFYDSKMSHTSPRTQTYRSSHTPTVLVNKVAF